MTTDPDFITVEVPFESEGEDAEKYRWITNEVGAATSASTGSSSSRAGEAASISTSSRRSISWSSPVS